MAASARALVGVARELRARADRGGRRIRICLEAEPGCALELTPHVVRFFEGPLAQAAGVERELIDAHLGVCYDLCHQARSEEHTSELQSRSDLVCRLLLEKKKKNRLIRLHLHPLTRERSIHPRNLASVAQSYTEHC